MKIKFYHKALITKFHATSESKNIRLAGQIFNYKYINNVFQATKDSRSLTDEEMHKMNLTIVLAYYPERVSRQHKDGESTQSTVVSLS